MTSSPQDRRMVFPKARLVVATVLFVGWLGYLGYLVHCTRDLIVVSRPQILVSTVCVLAKVEGDGERPERSLIVTKVLWSSEPDDLTGKTLELDELPDTGPAQGYDGPDEYLVPLVRVKDGDGFTHRVTPLPPMPGFGSLQKLELMKVGPHPEQVLQLVAEITHQPAEDEAPPLPLVLARNLPYDVAVEWGKRFDDAKATVRVTDGEVRIYRATPDVLAQFRGLKPGN